MNYFFDKIYVITCKNFHERHEYIKNHFHKMGMKFDFVISIDKAFFTNENIINSEKSLVLSHLNCVVNAKLHNYNQILICEDDVNFIDNFEQEFNNFIEILPKDWNFVQLGNAFWATQWLKRKFVKNNLYEFEWGSGSHCIGIKNNIFDKFIERFNIINKPADHLYYDLFINNKCYCPENFLADQLSKNFYLKHKDDKYIFESSLDKDRIKNE
jgi:GR25 family glycosyltransferase involved in LPS biosynthesis